MNAATDLDALTQKNKEAIGKALGRIASGVYIVTVGQGDEKDGMLATWLSQVAFEPPIVSIVVKKERPILSKLSFGSKLIVNVLGKGNMEIFKKFAKPFASIAEGMSRFDGLSVADNSDGPVLSDSVAFLSCSVLTQTAAGDHIVVLAQVLDGALLNADEPMVHLRSNGFQY
jgi:flavin reductase (DIM6/NTAB) family NADH-FMN oxidoreductase RutF